MKGGSTRNNGNGLHESKVGVKGFNAEDYCIEGLADETSTDTTQLGMNDLLCAFETLSQLSKQTPNRCAIAIYTALIIISAVGVYPGAPYAGEFSDALSNLVLRLNERDRKIFKGYVEASYLTANLAVNLVSSEKTVGQALSMTKARELLKDWRTLTCRYSVWRLGEELFSIVSAAIAVSAIDELNKPPMAVSHAEKLWSLVTRYVGDGVAGLQLWRAVHRTCCNSDARSVYMGAPYRSYRATLHGFKKELINRVLNIEPDIMRQSQVKPHVSAIAEGEEHNYSAFIRLLLAGWIIGFATLPYVMGTYGPAFREEFHDEQNKFVTIASQMVIVGMTLLLGLNTARFVGNLSDKLTALIRGVPTFHTPRISAVTFLEIALLAGIVLPSLSAAAARYGRFSLDGLDTVDQIQESAKIAVLGGFGLNARDLLDTAHQLVPPMLAKLMRMLGKKYQANKIVCGSTLRDFLSHVIHALSQDSVAESIGQPASTILPDQAEMPTSTSEKTSIAVKQHYPGSSTVIGLGFSIFHKPSSQVIQINKPEALEAIAMLAAASEVLDLEALYQYFLSEPDKNNLKQLTEFLRSGTQTSLESNGRRYSFA